MIFLNKDTSFENIFLRSKILIWVNIKPSYLRTTSTVLQVGYCRFDLLQRCLSWYPSCGFGWRWEISEIYNYIRIQKYTFQYKYCAMACDSINFRDRHVVN